MTADAHGARILGRLHPGPDGTGAIEIADVYDTGIDDLWSALTDPRRLARWIAEVEGDLRPGGQIYARFTSTWEGPGRIDVCQAPRALAVTWFPGTAEETVTEATLAAEGDKTRLVIEERGMPLAELAAAGAGWQAHVEDLAEHLAGRPAGDWRARWTAMMPAYQDLAGRPA